MKKNNPMRSQKIVTVCAKCLTETCLQTSLKCADAETAGTITDTEENVAKVPPSERARAWDANGQVKRERGHVNCCGLASDHEGDCRALSDDIDQHGRRIPFEDSVESTQAEARSCAHCNRAEALIEVTILPHLAHDGRQRQAVKGIDACIANVVRALNDGGVITTSSCCGHGRGDGSILLADGRELVIKACQIGVSRGAESAI